jgi:tRNA-2-methylthio-N6-dimethylallyladenosine synthase
MKVFLETMGCQMNKLDSELVLGQLRAAGHEITDDPRLADAVLYNTCSVRQHAENKVHGRLGLQSKRKMQGGKKIILGVLGCMAQRRGADLLKQFPQVDLVVGPGQIDHLPALLEAVAQTGAAQVAVAPPRRERPRSRDEEENARLEAFDLSRPEPGAAQAFVRVQRGCDKFCAYCIVPHVRGSEQSRDPSAVVEEVHRLADAGVTEVTLLGQTVNSYHWRHDGQDVGLADLLERLEPVAGIQRIRFITSYPAGFDRRILHAMRDLPKVCEYLHIPAQSGSDRMLRAMNRHYTVAEYLDLLAEACEIVPNLAVAGDFIVGFPGETEDDFAGSIDLVRKAGYKNSFIFKYSPRSGTPAAERLPDDVSEAVKKRRNNELLDVQNEVSLAHHTALIGTVQQVLVEGPSRRVDKQSSAPTAQAAQLVGRTRGDHIIVFDGPAALTGQLVDVEIRSATALAMTGVRRP